MYVAFSPLKLTFAAFVKVPTSDKSAVAPATIVIFWAESIFDVEITENAFVKFKFSVSRPVERISIPSAEPAERLIVVAAEPITEPAKTHPQNNLWW